MSCILRGVFFVFFPILLLFFAGLSLAGSLHYVYDSQNRLVSVENPGKYRIEYSYDPAGNRTTKKIIFSTSYYDIDGDGDIDGKDLAGFTGSWNGNSEKLTGFAAAFGTN